MTSYRINNQIRVPTIRLVDEDGKQLGVFANYEAQRIASERGKDLVEISPNQYPPICKIMDYGKFKYDSAKKEKDARKASKVLPVKEIQFSPNVETHDVQVKSKQIRDFINDGHKVRITMRFKGRDLQHVDLGRKLFEKIVDDLSDVCKIEQATEFNVNSLMVLVSKK